MIRLYESVPSGVTVDGKFYKCNFDFKNVLKMLDIMQRTDIVPEARDCICIKCVYSHRIRAKTVRKLYEAITDVLFEKTPETGAKRLTSFEQDAPLIRAAFRQVYGINLFNAKLSWFEFTELLHGLPEGNRYEDVIGIRAKPLPAPNKYNAKERQSLLEAKQRVALHLTEAEAEKKYDADVSKIFAGLMSMIPKEVKQDGK